MIVGMASKDNTDKGIQESDLSGLRDLQAMAKLLKPLHRIGTERDKANNRDLHMDQYCLLVLMWLYNPIIDSFRGLQQCSGLKNVQKRLGVGRASLGSLSESVTIFDPTPLAGLAEELSDKLPDRTPENFACVDKKITAVDGSVFRLLAQIAELAWLPKGDGKSSCGYRLHAQFEVFKGTPSRTTPPDHSTRLVIVKVKPHDSRRSKNGVSGASSDGYLRIVTNNLDVPAEIIAALYELRWTIELYFRIIKQLLGCRHLLSTKANGVTIQIYMAIIACIMILAMTGKLPTKRTYEMICFYLLGLAELDELEAHIQQLPPK